MVTGHTGFKGAWLSLWLQHLGAEVTGFSDGIPTEPSLFVLAGVEDGLAAHVVGDVRDPEAVDAALAAAEPEVVFHLAAQPLVRASFADPRTTYATNLMGTVNVLEAVRRTSGVRAVVNVTSDKSYENREDGRAFVEDDRMGGHDPYSSSKGCAELVTTAFRDSFGLRVASVRAGNVVGGGDWGEDRLVPDIMRAAAAGEPIAIRNPTAVRPWQHVLNPLSGYLLLAERLHAGEPVDAGWNFGPDPEDVQSVQWLVEHLTGRWPDALDWVYDAGPHPHEAQYLALDSTKAREELGWRPLLPLAGALDAIVEWHLALRDGADPKAATLSQIAAFS